jgi:hypothetical protein
MGTQSAEVQTLTAEVRVLMVGNRQVTLSVYRQLDEVKPEDIEPFGRVRLSHDAHGWIYVVGMGKSGDLVRAKASPWVYCAQLDFDLAPKDQWCFVGGDGDRRYKYPSPLNAAWSALPLIVLAGLR